MDGYNVDFLFMDISLFFFVLYCSPYSTTTKNFSFFSFSLRNVSIRFALKAAPVMSINFVKGTLVSSTSAQQLMSPQLSQEAAAFIFTAVIRVYTADVLILTA